MNAPAPFPGFPPHTLSFLHQLAQNNEREWFQAHRADYESGVLEPALDFISAMEAPLAKISPRFMCIPKRVGGSLLRIYRDTRFARDKRPYKTNIGIHFRHEDFAAFHLLNTSNNETHTLIERKPEAGHAIIGNSDPAASALI